MTPEMLECQVCGLSLDACTCPDIDERLYTYTASLKVIAKRPVGERHERLENSLAYNKFRAKAIDVVVSPVTEPWEGFRDKVFGPVSVQPVVVDVEPSS